MKFYKVAILFIAISLTTSVSSVFAQDNNDNMKEMGKEEWLRQTNELKTRKNDLKNQLNSMNADIEALKKMTRDKDAQLEKSVNDHYGSVGATKSEVAEYRKKFEATEKKINGKSGTVEEILSAFAEIEASKIRCLPEFWDRYQTLKRKTTGLGLSAERTYTVIKGDCLSKIAGMKNFYDNWKLWPVIWEANKIGVVSAPARTPKTIPNPNLIYSGQVLKVPYLTQPVIDDSINKSGTWERYLVHRKTGI